jgi:RNA polymerase sigma-70 factor (ECF subfamily)
LLRYLVARRVRSDEADDILQDLFVKLAEQTPGPIAEPRAYLYRMTENLLLDRRRSAGRRGNREASWVALQSGGALDADERPSAEEALIARERLAMVTEALERLPARTIGIFRRFRMDGVPQKDIAAELGISLSAVEKHLQKAYQVIVEARARIDADSAPSDRHGNVRAQ